MLPHAPIKEILGGFGRMSAYARTNSATDRAADDAAERPAHQAKGNRPGDVACPVEVRPAFMAGVLRRAIRDRYIARRSRARRQEQKAGNDDMFHGLRELSQPQSAGK